MSQVQDSKQNLLVKAKPPIEGYSKIVGRGEKGLKHLEFGLLRLSSGEWSAETGECEVALDIFSGGVSIEAASPSGKLAGQNLGGRKSVFDGPPTVIYLPAGTSYRIKVARGPAEISVWSAVAPDFKGAPVVIGPDEVIKTSPGKDNWLRNVHTAIGANMEAGKLIFGETTNPPGNWSSAPPHKHDAFNPPNEVPLEEIYYFQVNPAQGFGIIRVYTDPSDPEQMDTAYVVENGDTVVIPKGYHPVAAAPGYSVHYTWAMAGEVRKPGALSDDPRHAWLKNT